MRTNGGYEMLSSKHANLRPLLESKDGIHLTAYLVHGGDVQSLKDQLKTTIEEANEWLIHAMPTEERHRFLEPLQSFMHNSDLLSQIKSNIGIFRNEHSFRILNIPIEIAQNCQVATSFHVKPLLRWMQGDQNFLFLGIAEDVAYLYDGNQTTFKLIDTFTMTSGPADQFAGVCGWISELTKNSRPKLFLAAEPPQLMALQRRLSYKNTVLTPIAGSFEAARLFEYCQSIRHVLTEDSKKSLEQALLEFRFAEDGNRAKKNIFQIARAVVQGKVRKLIVTDELSIFGKIDLNTGGLAIHPFDLDHEDDCILDDLAQIVLSQGGQVIIAKRSEIPKGRPVLAILADEEQEQSRSEDLFQKIPEARCG